MSNYPDNYTKKECEMGIDKAYEKLADESLETLAREWSEKIRASVHANYNGGHTHDDQACEAFHHGMDTVCNVLSKGSLTALLRSVRDDWVREVKPNVIKDAFKLRDERAKRIVKEVAEKVYSTPHHDSYTDACDEILRRLEAPDA